MRRIIISVTALAIFLSSCKKSENEPVEENELITTVTLQFTEGANTKSFTWKDSDGEGGNAPIIDKIELFPNKTYKLNTILLDESKSPVIKISDEVKKEAEEHLFLYKGTPSDLLSYIYSDKDAKGFPLGIEGTIVTQKSGRGSLNVRLRHQPEVGGKPTKNGTEGPGSDDLNVNFEFVVQ